jgi:hypothetical protein
MDMKKYLKYYVVLAFAMLPFAMYALEAEKYKLTNFKQVDETSFTFDLELHNTGDVAFGLDAAQCKIVYNQGIFGAQSANISQGEAVTFVSTNLVGWYGKSGIINPTDAQKVTITGNPGYIVFVTNALANPTYQQIDFLIPGAFLKLATIKVQFAALGILPPYTSSTHPFEEVVHGLAFDPNMINHTVNRVTTYDNTTTPGIVYKVGTTGLFTQMPQPAVENLPAFSANRLLAKYCFTGTGNYTDAVRWNNATTSGVTFNIVPPATSNAIIDGACTINANNTVNDLTINGGGQLTLNSGNSTSATNLYINSDATTGTGTFVDMNATSSTGGLTVSSATNVQQYVTTGRNWYVSSPVASGAASIVTGTTGNTLSSYVEPTAAWITADPSFTVAKGYVANVIPTNGNLLFTGGALNTGLQTNSALTRSVVASTGFNLVGNPYPSYVNWLQAQTNSTNLEPTMWYRTKNNATLPLYVFDTFNATPGIGTNNNGLGAVTGDIAPMQAFWVRVMPAQTTGTLSLTNAMRTHQNQGVASNRLKTRSSAGSTQQVLRLQVSNGINSDEAIVLFNPKASDGYDAYDSGKMSNNNPVIPEIYTIAANEKLVINGLNSVYTNEEVPMGFTTGEDNSFTIQATEISNFDDNTKIVLRDKLLNTEKELETGNPYIFSSEKASTSTRFSIVFKSTSVTTGIGNTDASGSESVFIYKNQDGRITVSRKDAIGEGTVTVCNAIGQVLTNQSTTGTITVVEKKFIPGVYLVKLTLAGKNTTKKVIIN